MIGLQCVILAGGLGTRVRHLARELPKALIPINGTPFADLQLQWLREQGVAEVVYCVGHKSDAIRNFVGDGSGWSVHVTYVEDGPRLLGTAGALRHGLDLGVIREPFITLYGDAFLPVPYPPVVAAFDRSGLPALMTVFRNEDAWGPSNVVFAGDRVQLHDKRPEAKRPDMRYIDYGLSVLTAGPIEGMVAAGEVADLSDVFRELSLRGLLAGYEVDRRFYEVGSAAGIRDLEGYLRRTAPAPPL
ncbi:MAG TPA: sugar phosphate nucleotidyltransferase [Acidimicrobiia bacterium]|nr:sugar phosphate nucleotidyltransferase [Acidimicrobiia bacterium]